MTDMTFASQERARDHVRKAEEYHKLGLSAQVQHELWEAQQIDPTIVRDPRFQALVSGAASAVQQEQSLHGPMRIGAVMLFVNAVIGVFLIFVLFALGQASSLGRGDVIGPIVDVIIGVNLWRLKRPWQRYTVAWAILGLLLWGGIALAKHDWLSLVVQSAFSGSLILLLAGTPSRGRTIAAVVLYVIGYIGVLFASLALIALAAMAGPF